MSHFRYDETRTALVLVLKIDWAIWLDVDIPYLSELLLVLLHLELVF